MWKHVRYGGLDEKDIYVRCAYRVLQITSHAKRFIELFLIDGIGMCGGACDDVAVAERVRDDTCARANIHLI